MHKQTMKKYLATILAVLIIGSVYYLYEDNDKYLKIDNAYISGKLIKIISHQDGKISNVNMRRFSELNKGQRLLEVNQEAAQISLNKSRNLFNKAVREAAQRCELSEISKIEYDISKLEVAKRLKDKIRYEKLKQNNLHSKNSYEEHLYVHAISEQEFKITEHRYNRHLISARGKVLDNPQVLKSLFEFKESYYRWLQSVIVSPINSYVYEDFVYENQQVEKGDLLAIIIPLDNIFIEANVLESKVAQLRLGQKVDIRIPSLKGNKKLKGFIHSITPAVASTFSPIPKYNTDSNWIKTSERIPIQIKFMDIKNMISAEYVLGASVELTIDLETSKSHQPVTNYLVTQQQVTEKQNWQDDFNKEVQALIAKEKKYLSQISSEFSCLAGLF